MHRLFEEFETQCQLKENDLYYWFVTFNPKEAKDMKTHPRRKLKGGKLQDPNDAMSQKDGYLMMLLFDAVLGTKFTNYEHLT